MESFAKNINKLKKIYVEHGGKTVCKKIIHTLTSRNISQTSKFFAKREKIFHELDERVIDNDIELLFGSGLLMSTGEIKAEIQLLPNDVGRKIIDEADGIIKKKFVIFGGLEVQMGEMSNLWHRDPITGFVWPDELTLNNILTGKPVGTDIKTLWEVARFQFLCPLAYAYIITGLKRYQLFAIEIIESWLDENKTSSGPHWSQTMEPSIRLVNWCFYLPLLDIFKSSKQSLRDKITNSLIEHLLFIRENLENSPGGINNHYLSNLSALLIGRLIFPSWSWAKECSLFAEKEFEKEVQIQFKASGINFEGSLPYHRLSLEICLLGAAFIKRSGGKLAHSVEERLRKAVALTEVYSEVSEECPCIGDNDSGIFVKFFVGQELNKHRYLCYLLGSILDDSNEAENWGDFLCKVHFTGTKSSPVHCLNKKAKVPIDTKILVKEFNGLVVARFCRDGFLFNMQHSLEGHVHNDKLAFYPVIGGKHLFLDRGSFSYTGFPDKRHKDRISLSHNCPVVNGWEQNRIWKNDLFALGFDSQCFNDTRKSDRVLEVTGWHTGYYRYKNGLKVFRKIYWDTNNKVIEIIDWIERIMSNETYQFSWCFLINPAWNADLKDDGLSLVHDDRVIRFEHKDSGCLTLVGGYYSPSYQIEKPCKALNLSKNMKVGEKNEFILRY